MANTDRDQKPDEILKLETIIGNEITQVDADKIWDNGFAPSFCLDANEAVVGLNLYQCNLSDLSSLSSLTRLTDLNLERNQITDLSAFKGMRGLSYLDLNTNNIEDISPLKKLTNMIYLNLSENRIRFIESLVDMKYLDHLVLSFNPIADIKPLSALIQLTKLSLNNNQIKDLTPLVELINLKELFLFDNQITDMIPLMRLVNLEKLFFDNNSTSDLTPLVHLVNLKELYFRNNQVTNITPLKNLINLERLVLGNNKITDLTPLAYLNSLRELYLKNNQISDLTPLFTLINLRALDLSNNPISDLAPLMNLINLEEIAVNNSQITYLIPLRTLINLKVLFLSNNQITDVKPLKELKNLRIINLSNNKITRLPPDITQWWPNKEILLDEFDYNINELNVFGNPLETPPIEIVKQGREAIQNYFQEMELEPVLFLESKLLVVGNGEVGKTTLMKKLLDNNFTFEVGKEDTTRGINITPWNLPVTFNNGETHDVGLHFWDFGGQEILHATHQFFLTKRSLYLFVWEARKEDETQAFDYWLNIIHLLSADSPVIMVMNKSELRVKPIAEASLQQKFSNIKSFIQVSCVNGDRILELTEKIKSELAQMPHLLDKLPKRWLDIRNELNKQKENYIDLDEYFNICLSHSMGNKQALFLSDYLHDLGTILHFQNDAELNDTVILKPEWATGAVYALIDSLNLQKSEGKFNYADLSNYWKPPKYPKDKYNILLRLMEKFELCFKIADKDEYILPELLPAERTDIDFTPFRSSQNLKLHYSYEFMPAGIITRFISRVHYLIHEDHYWKNGVELSFYESSALVESDSIQKRIRISVSGKSPLQLMAIIRSHLDHIHETLNMKKGEHVVEEIPCYCFECSKSDKPHLFKYHVLERFQTKGKKTVDCEKSAEDVSIEHLLNGFTPPKQEGNLFDSLITVVSQVQGISKTLQTDENSRNTVVALLLRTIGFRALDQTLWSKSGSGKRIGELDIKIEDEKNRTLSIIEALNLDSLDKKEIYDHILKLLEYDCGGVEENYILAYVSAKDFSGFCDKYKDYIVTINYGKYPLIGTIDNEETGFQKIISYRTRHKCNTGETRIHHILVDMSWIEKK